MIKNPFFARYNLLADTISAVSDKESEKHDQIIWYDKFDADEVFSTLNITLREISQLKIKMEEILPDLSRLTLHVKSLKQAASLGWDPRYWFSSERSAKLSQLDDLRKSLALLTSKHDELQQLIQSKVAQCVKQQVDLDRYRAFNRLEADATLKALKSHVVQLRAELNQVRLRKEQVDEQLREPLAELRKVQSQKSNLETEIDRAMTFDKRLNNASNSYERKMVHEECSANFSESSPARVISARQRELQSVNRTIGKLDDRLQSIVERASRVVKTLVIDGNNLCYQHQTFIGLSALQAVVQKLSRDFPVVIVFDATIRRQLQMSDREISAQFRETVRVHVVASKQKADETLLDTARDPDTYVISNDRFKDFPDKSAVRDRRLIRHEILDDTVFVHDLSVAEDFT